MWLDIQLVPVACWDHRGCAINLRSCKHALKLLYTVVTSAIMKEMLELWLHSGLCIMWVPTSRLIKTCRQCSSMEQLVFLLLPKCTSSEIFCSLRFWRSYIGAGMSVTAIFVLSWTFPVRFSWNEKYIASCIACIMSNDRKACHSVQESPHSTTGKSQQQWRGLHVWPWFPAVCL